MPPRVILQLTIWFAAFLSLASLGMHPVYAMGIALVVALLIGWMVGRRGH